MALQYKKKDDYLMVYKPAGVPSTPGEEPNSIVEQVLTQFPEQRSIKGFKLGEGGLLYRLDTVTSGLVLFACSEKAFERFIAATDKNEIEKLYLVLVAGRMQRQEGEIHFRIAHDPRSKARMVIARHGNENKRGEWRQADTYYRVVETRGDHSLLEVSIGRGSRHQIRVHFAAIGHPLCSDTLYGNKGVKEPAFFLECTSINWPAQAVSFHLEELFGKSSGQA